MKPKIIFTDSTTDFVLEAMGYHIGPSGFIKDKNGELVLADNNEPFKSHEIAAIYKDKNGKTQFTKGDLGSIMDFVKNNEL